MEVQVLKREFKFTKDGKTQELPDPNPAWTPQKVKEHYVSHHPELINASVGEPNITSDTITYEFAIKTGTKG